MKKNLLLIACLCMAFSSIAQTNYNVSYSSNAGNPGGLNTDQDTVITGWNGLLSPGLSNNQWSAPVPLPFNFNYYGNPITTFRASANGLVSFAVSPALPNNNQNLPSSSLPDSTIACFWDAFTSSEPTNTDDNVVWKVWGTAPNRQLWVKWSSFEIGAPAVNNASFACVLEETTNNIYLVEGLFTTGSTVPATSVTAGIQLNQTTARQYGDQYRQRVANLAAPTDNNYILFAPYIPVNMSYVSSTTSQPVVTDVPKNSTNEAMLRISITTTGELNPITLSQVDFSTSGTTNTGDIINAKIFYTGTDSNFNNSLQFGNTAPSPNGSTSIAGSQTLVSGTNYFWLTYSISNSATSTNIVDVECTQLVVGGVSQTPSTVAPAGSRSISNGLSGIITVGTLGTYTHLSDAFKAINASGLSGDLQLSIISDITDTAAAALNYLSGSNYKINIVPSSNVVRNISASIPGSYITFNGTRNLTIDGRDPISGTGKFLRLVNNDSTGSVITFINGAKYDSIRYCTIESGCWLETRGSVFIGTSANGTPNQYLVLNNNDIRDISSATGLQNIAVMSSGSDLSPNSHISITNNNIYNFRRVGVYVTSTGNGGNWNISDNSFYYNSPNNLTAGDQVCVVFQPGQASNYNNINGNYIGGQAPLCGGAAWTSNKPYNWVGINVAAGLDPGTSVQGNTIQNINLTATTAGMAFVGIRSESGTLNVGTITGNLIGSTTVSNSITSSLPLNLIIYAFLTSNGNVNVANNTIANFTYNGGSNAGSVRGINFQRGAAVPNIYNNLIFNLTSNAITTSATTNSLQGIGLAGGENINTIIRNNTIYNLFNTAASANTNPGGIIIDNTSSNGIVENNKIYNLTNTSPGATAAIHGIFVSGPARNWTFANNMISITNGANTNSPIIRGISDQASGNTCKYYNNTVYIGGTATSGAGNSFAFERRNASSIPTLRNNILYNERTGGTGIHTAIGNVVAATNWTSSTSGYNLLVAANAANIGAWSTSFTAQSFSQWQTISGGDQTSWSDIAANVPSATFFNNTSTGDLGINSSNAVCWYSNGKGIALANMTADIEGHFRSNSIVSGPVDLGADEFGTFTTPPAATATGNIAVNDSSTYTFAGRSIAKVYWTAGALPISADCRYYSGTGVALPLNVSGAVFFSHTDFTTAGGGSYTFDIKLNYDSAQFGSVTKAADILNLQLSPVTYHYLTTVDQTDRSYRVNNLTDLTMFSGTDVDYPAPVSLVKFAGQAVKNNVNLYWQTASEVNSSRFEIEVSADSKNFLLAGTVKARGNSQVLTNYSFTDEEAFPRTGASKLFYRLKMIDLDGSYEYSNVISVDQSKEISVKVELYPNPYSEATRLFIISELEDQANVQITDLQGKLISNGSINLQKGINSFMPAEMTSAPSGIYFIRIENGQNIQTLKLIK